jgi:hypothetical protein
VFGVESGLSTVHFPLEQWIFHARFFFWRGGGVGQSKEFPDMFIMVNLIGLLQKEE